MSYIPCSSVQEDLLNLVTLTLWLLSGSLNDSNLSAITENIISMQELGLSPSVPVHVVLQDWIRHSDGKLSFLGFVRLLHGVSSRTFQKA